MAINLSLVKGLWARVGERTKLIGVGVLAFVLGTLWGGHRTVSNENGRFVAIGTDGLTLLDTRTGEVWVRISDSQGYKRIPAPTHSWF